MLGYRDLQWKGNKLMFGSDTKARIIADPIWPNMFRVEYPPGTISDMTNLTRAHDAACHLVLEHLNSRISSSRITAQELARFANRPSMGPYSLPTTITAPSSLSA